MASRRYERVAIGGMQLRQSLTYSGRAGRPSRHRARLVRHRDRLAKMGDRLLEGRAAKRLVARLTPPFDRDIVEAGLGEMMGDRFGLGVGVAQRLGRAAVKRLAAALEQALVGRVLDQRVLETIGGGRRGASANRRSASVSRSSAVWRRSSSNPAAIDDTSLSSR